jgi:hypothetical protein
MEVKIKVPESLEEITVEQYQKFIAVNEKVKEGDFLLQKMVEIFCKIKLSHVLLIKFTSINEIVGHINELFSKEHKLQQTFKIQDMEFGFIPDLENISFGEYVDLEANLQSWETMHKAMSVMYRPIEHKKGDKYTIRDYTASEEFDELMKHAPLSAAMGAMVFFYNLGNELLRVIPSYLEGELKTILTANKHNSTSLGDGITQSMHSLEETLGTLTLLQNYHSNSASLG